MKTDIDEDRNQQLTGKHGLFIFDGSCGACSTFIGRRREFFKRHGFAVAPLQDSRVQELVGVDEATLNEAIHLRTKEGALLKGLDSFLYFAGTVWWLAPVGFLAGTWPIKPIFAKVYDFIAKRRRKISAMCGLQSKALYK